MANIIKYTGGETITATVSNIFCNDAQAYWYTGSYPPFGESYIINGIYDDNNNETTDDFTYNTKIANSSRFTFKTAPSLISGIDGIKRTPSFVISYIKLLPKYHNNYGGECISSNTVEVRQASTDVLLSPEKIISFGKTYKYKYDILPSNVFNKHVNFTDTNSYLSIYDDYNDNGVSYFRITPKNVGTTVLTAKAADGKSKERQFVINIVPGNPEISTIPDNIIYTGVDYPYGINNYTTVAFASNTPGYFYINGNKYDTSYTNGNISYTDIVSRINTSYVHTQFMGPLLFTPYSQNYNKLEIDPKSNAITVNKATFYTNELHYNTEVHLSCIGPLNNDDTTIVCSTYASPKIKNNFRIDIENNVVWYITTDNGISARLVPKTSYVYKLDIFKYLKSLGPSTNLSYITLTSYLISNIANKGVCYTTPNYDIYNDIVSYTKNTIIFTPDNSYYVDKTHYRYKVIYTDGTSNYENRTLTNDTTIQSVEVLSGVTQITVKEFYGCKNLTKVVLPETVTFISASAFSSCPLLTEINFPSNLLYIGDNAFEYSNMPSIINLSNTKLLTIEKYAFQGCNNITEVIFPVTIQEIGEHAFGNCSKLGKVQTNAISCKYGKAVYYNTPMKELTITLNGKPLGYYFGETADEDNCQTVYEQVYDLILDKTIDKVIKYNIPQQLRTVTILDKELPDYAFKDCSSITTININPIIRSFPKYCLYNCRLYNSTMSTTINSAGEYAFSNATFMYATQLTLSPSGGYDCYSEHAFENLNLMVERSELLLPAPTGYYTNVFKCKLNVYRLNIIASDIDLENSDIRATELIIGDKVSRIISLPCLNLLYLYLGANITYINRAAFYAKVTAYNLEYNISSVDVANELARGADTETSIFNLLMINMLRIGSECRQLVENMFMNTSVSKLLFDPNTRINTIPARCFAYTKLTAISTPASVTTICESAFANCVKLSSIYIGNTGTTNLGTCCFAYSETECGSKSILLGIRFNGSINFIGYNCFQGCVNCKEIYYSSLQPPTFFGRPSSTALYGEEDESAEYPWGKLNGNYMIGSETTESNKFIVPTNATFTKDVFEIKRGKHYLFDPAYGKFELLATAPPVKSLSDLFIGDNMIDNTDTSKTQYMPNATRTGRLYSFVPNETAAFRFAFNDTAYSNLDTYMYLYDENFEVLTANDDSNGNMDPRFDYTCNVGTKYYIIVTGFTDGPTPVKGILTILKV